MRVEDTVRGLVCALALFQFGLLSSEAFALDLDLVEVGSWPEIPAGLRLGQVQVRGEYAYAIGERLAIFDVSDPTDPELLSIGETIRGERYARLVLSGDHAYISTSSALLVVNVSDPASPCQVGTAPHGGEELAIAGNHVYLAGGDSVKVLGVGDPERPELVGSWSAPGADLRDLQIAGGHAYVADIAGGLRVLDVSTDPAAPNEVIHFDEGIHGVWRVVVSGGHAYLNVSEGGPMVVLDVSQPEAPSVVHTGRGAIWQVSGDRGYGQGLFDLSDPAAPRELAGWIISDLGFVSGDHAYLPGEFGIEVLDVSHPGGESPYVGFYSPVDEFDTGDGFAAMALEGDLVYMVGNGRGSVADRGTTLQAIDVSDPASPRRVGAAPFDFIDVQDLAVSGGLAFVVELSAPFDPQDPPAALRGVLHVIPVENSVNMVEVARLELRERSFALALQDRGQDRAFAYIGDCDGLVVVDITSPFDPRLVGSFDHSGGEYACSGSVFVSGDRLYLTGSTNGLEVIDVSNPQNPVLLGESGGDLCCGLSVSGNHVYAGLSGGGLMEGFGVFDVSDPRDPREVGRVSTGMRIFQSDVAVSGNRAFVTTRYDLFVIDVSEPTAPQVLGSYGTRSSFNESVIMSGALAFVGSGALDVIDTRVPPVQPPPVVGAHEIEHAGVSDVFVAGGHAYVTDLDGPGMYVLDVANPSAPRTVARFESPVFARYLREGGEIYAPSFDVNVVGNHAYLSGLVTRIPSFGLKLEVINVSDPSSPQSVGSYEAAGSREVAAIYGDRAYLRAEQDARPNIFEILDISNPAKPQSLGSYENAKIAAHGPGLFFSGEHVWVQANQQILVVSLRGPDALRVVATHAGAELGALRYVAGDTLYTAREEGGEIGLEIFDVVDPRQPRRLSRREMSVPGILFISEGYAYSSRVNSPFQLLTDVRDRTDPQPAGRYLGQILAAAGGYAYALGALNVINVSRPAYAQLAGSVRVRRGQLVVAGNHGYVAARSSGLLVFDLSDPNQPEQIGTLETTGAEVYRLALSRSHAYIANMVAGLLVVDVSDPANSRRAGGLDTDGHVYDVFVAGDLAYAVEFLPDSSQSRLLVLDVSAPSRPLLIGAIDLGEGQATRVVASGGRAYVAYNGLQLVDLSDSAAPQLIALDPRPVVDLAVDGDLVYVSVPAGLLVLDARDPASPPLSTTDCCSGLLAVRGDYVHVLGNDLALGSGLNVLDVSDPARPRRVGWNSRLAGRSTSALAVSGDRVYTITTQNTGTSRFDLEVLELAVPFPPTNVRATAGDGEVELAWNPPTGGATPSGYDVYEITGGSRTRLNEQPLAGTSVTVAELEDGLEHCFVVQSVRANGAASYDSDPPACATPQSERPRFLRGDCNADGQVAGQVTDAVFLLNYNFQGRGSPSCVAACDANGDGLVHGIVSDAVYLLSFNFRGGPAPAAPFPSCGPATLPTDGQLGCETPPMACE